MGILGNLFTSKYGSTQLVKAYKSQKISDKYDFLNFSLLECSNNDVSSKEFIQIFSEAHDILNNTNKLSKEEVWIFLDMGILFQLGEMDMIDFMSRKILQMGKLSSIYAIFLQYTQEEREIISSISSTSWNDKVSIFNIENRLADTDDSYPYFNSLPSHEREIWREYNRELYQKII